ncbi:MAG: hypothetical protein GY765_33300 [bacterium]|nr:hypothetical protein [bacterium]
MTKQIIKFLDLFQWFFRMMKVDYPVFREILWVKITSDNRRQHSNINLKKKEGKENSGTLWKSLFMNLFIGFFIGLSVLFVKTFFLANMFVFSGIIVMSCLALVSDFTSVLIDTTDNSILLPRPVDGRTILMARITHIVIYLFFVVMSLALPALIFGIFKYGILYVLLMLPSLLFATLFVVFVTNLFYMSILKFTSGEKFRDIINYIQVFTVAIFSFGINLLPRMLNIDTLGKMDIPLDWWACWFPPAWFAAGLETLLHGRWSMFHGLMAAQSVVIPLMGIFIVVRFLGPNFNRKLAQLDSSESERKKRFRFDFPGFFSRFLSRSVVEKVGFEMTWKLAARDRKFKLSTYPALGMYPLFAYMMLRPGKGETLMQVLTEMPQGRKYIGLIYFSLFLFFSALSYFTYSEKFQAAWIYRATPVERPGELLSGAFKSLSVKMMAPFLVTVVLIVSVWGFGTLDDIVFGFLAVHMGCLFFVLGLDKQLPFSRKHAVSGTAMARGVGWVLMTIFIVLVLGLLHYFLLSKIALAVMIGNVVLAVVVVIMLKVYRRTAWAKIKAD